MLQCATPVSRAAPVPRVRGGRGLGEAPAHRHPDPKPTWHRRRPRPDPRRGLRVGSV